MTTLTRIDEALRRPGTTALDRARLLRKRKRLYEYRHPAPTHDTTLRTPAAKAALDWLKSLWSRATNKQRVDFRAWIGRKGKD